MGKIIILCICFCALCVQWMVLFRNFRNPPDGMKGTDGMGEGWLRFVYPTAYRIHIILRNKVFSDYPEEKIKKLVQTQPGRSREELEEAYDCRRIGGVLLLFFLTLGMVLLSILGEDRKQILQNSCLLIRGEPGMGSRQVQLAVKSEDNEKQITMVIPERRYQREELEAKLAEAKEYVKKQYLGENASSEEIIKPLRLVRRIPDNQIKIKWRLDGNGYVNKDGSLNNKDLLEKTEAMVTAVFSYGQEIEKMPLQVMIYPAVRTEEEAFWEEWQQEARRQEEETSQENILPLPKKVVGKRLSYRQIMRSHWPRILLGGLILCMFLPALMDYQTEQRVMERERELQREYPGIVERFMLLLGAGLTIRGAWYRITDDYLQRCQKKGYSTNYLYEEMLITRHEMENGLNEAAAYAGFGRRISLLQYMKFSTLLVQNLKKGSDDLLKRMDLEAVDALRERREAAKRLGEEAGTKLLFPMMLMLIIVFSIILIAAFQNM